MSYESEVKKIIRIKHDLCFIKKFCEDNSKKCKYFGLSGPDFYDILDWDDFIEKVLTVEYNEEKIPILIKNLHVNNLESRVNYIQDDIIKLIIEEDPKIIYPYDLINFDFLGTFIYQYKLKFKKPKMERIEVFKKLIEYQYRFLKVDESFLFFITLNSQRGKDITIFENALKSLKRDYNIEEVEWLISKKNKVTQYQKIAYILPSLIFKSCLNKFNLTNFKIIIYQGKKNIMVHFCFYLKKVRGSYLNFSDINLKRLSDLPIILIQKSGKELKIRGKNFFSSEDPFKI